MSKQLGLNLAMGSYFDTQLPFLNVLKQASNGLADNVGSIWATQNAGGTLTNEEPYLQLDSDGYATSLTASPIPSGGQLFTKLDTATMVNVGLGNGAATVYPADTYVFMWQGKGTFVFKGDVTSLASASAGCTITGLQVVSTNAWGTTNSVTLQGSGTAGVLTPSSGGIRFDLTAIPDSGNYPKAMACVQSTYLSAYNGGQIFHPLFLAWLGKWPLASLRFMKPQKTEYEVIGGEFSWVFPCTFSANPQSGDASAVLTSTTPIRPGVRNITLQNGQTLAATFTAGSTTVAFSPTVSSNCTGAYFYLHQTTGYSDRSVVSNVAYSTNSKGWPLEICCALANTLSCSPHINMPVSWGATDWASAATLIQSTLTSSLLAYIEGGNEVWNGGYAVANFAINKSIALWGGSGDGLSWYGRQVALMADQFATVFGNPGFDNRICVVMGGQSANTAVINQTLTTPSWTGNTPPWQRTSASGKKTVKLPVIAPYFGNGSIPSADYTFIQAQGDPTGTWISSFTANPVAGHTFTSNGSTALPAGGWFGYCAAQVAATITVIATYGYTTLGFYETGQQFDNQSSGQGPFLVAAWRDARVQAPFYAFFGAMIAAGATGPMNLFDFCEAATTIANGGQWGTIESVMQPQTPAPPRFAAAVQFGGPTVVPLSLDGAVGSASFTGDNGTVTLTTTSSNEPIVVLVANNGGGIATGVTSAHLTFTRRAHIPSAGNLDEWTAVATGPLTAEVITVAYPNPITLFSAVAFGVLGAPGVSFFDPNASLPVATNTSATPTFSTTNAATIVFGAVRASISAPTPGAGWTAIYNPSGSFFIAQYQIVSSVQTGTSFTATAGTPNGWVVDAIVAAQQPSSGALPHGGFMVNVGFLKT